MAIKKSKILPSGVVGEYWKITNESYNRLTGECIWILSLFISKDISDAGKEPLKVTKVYKILITEQEAAGDRTALGYAKVKAKAELEINPTPGMLGGPFLFDIDLANGEDI